MAFEPFRKTDLPSMANFNAKFLSAIDTAVPVGSVFWCASENIPDGFLLCDGSELNRETYSALFTVIGTVFGEGDGSTTFSLPDLRAKFVRGAGESNGYTGVFGETQEATNFVSGEHIIDSDVNDYDKFDDRASHMGANSTSWINEYHYYTRPYNIALTPIIKY